MSTPRRRSLIKKKDSSSTSDVDAIEAIESTTASDLREFGPFYEADEDLEVVEPTPRPGHSSFDALGPTLDSAVMDDYSDELAGGGLWLGDRGSKGKRTADDIFRNDPEEFEPTEPGIDIDELLPPPRQQAREREEGVVRAPTPQPATQRIDLAQVMAERRRQADRYNTRVATEEERNLAEATPWLAAMGLTIGFAAVALLMVVLFAVFMATRPVERVQPELPPQPPMPEVVEAPAEVEPAEEDPEAVEEPEEAPAPAPAPRPPPAPVPEPEPEPVAAPAPAPVVAPAPAPAPEPEKKRGGLFKKKK